MTKSRPPREKEAQARARAFAAARIVLSQNKAVREASEMTGATKSSVDSALVILTFGNPEEVSAVENGNISLEKTADAVRARTPKEDRRAKRRPPTRSALMKYGIEFDALIWGHLREALDAITKLPSPKDTAVIVRKNAMRLDHINRKLLAALEWIQEFSNEVTL